jgi:ATP-dependent Lhr-like helicase
MRPVPAPLDVLCQQLVGMACTDDPEIEWAYQLVRRASPFASLERSDFDSCLAFLAGETPGPAGAIADSTSGQPRWTSPRLWKAHGKYGLSSQRVRRWFRSNVGTIASEDSIRVLVIGSDPAASSVVGTLDTVFAERLLPGDRFLLDGRSMEFRGREGPIVTARRSRGDSQLPVWKSDRSSMSAPLARQVADFREAAVERLREGVQVFATWLGQEYQLGSREIDVLGEHLESQDRLSEIPPPRGILVEETLEEDGWCYAFHAPLARAACEPIARAVTVRLGLSTRRDLALYVGDLGWTLRLPDELRLRRNELLALLRPDAFIEDVLQGIEHGELLSTRFRYIADTALLVLRNGDGRRMRVGGLNWVSQRLYPLIKAVCPDHPLLRETRREVLDDLFDTPTAQQWLESRPLVRFRTLAAASPFATAWLDYRRPEPVRFESPTEALRRLHARLASATSTSGTTAS